MKLSQLGLTQSGQKATKKLSHQVHKATVAAAMEPKLCLGVVGIEIGQEQSKGLTSLISEETTNTWKLINNMSELLGWKLTFTFIEGDFDREEAADDAVKIARLRRSGDNSYAVANHALNSIANLLGGPSRGHFEQLKNTVEALSEKVTMVDWFGAGIHSILILQQKAKAMATHAAAVESIADFLSELDRFQPEKGGEWAEYTPLINAFLKKLGIR